MQKPKAPSALAPKALALLREAAAQSEPIYLVGGALRDCLLGRAVTDLDVATKGAKKTALRLSKTLRGTFVALDEEHGVYRIALGKAAGSVQYIDVAEIQGADIGADLLRRDFAFNAMAFPLTIKMPARLSAPTILDPRGGLADLKKGLLRAPSEAVFKDDPLRLLRAFRIAAQLGFALEPKTLEMMRRNRNLIRHPAGERIQSELLLLLAIEGCSRWIALMDQCGLLTALFKELEPSRLCATEYYGEGGVLAHSLATVARADFLMNHLREAFPDLGRPLEKYMAERSTGQVPHRAALILAALLHDVAKPATAKEVDGRLRFFGHDVLGAKTASAILKRLKFSRDSIDVISTAIAHHLRPGNLAAGGTVSDKAIYRFFRDIGANAVSLLLVCWSDHASYLPEKTFLRLLKEGLNDPNTADLSSVRPPDARKTVRHLQVVHLLLKHHFKKPALVNPPKLVTGHDVIKALRLAPGPKIGEILEAVQEAQATGKISSRQQALIYLSSLK